jgi:serine/threonine protein kinase
MGFIKYNGKKNLRFFYKAKYNGRECFIKLGENDAISMNREISANKYIKECGLDFIPDMLICDEFYDDDTVMIATEYIFGLKNFETPENQEHFEKVCVSFEYVHRCLEKFGIIHGDLNRSNIALRGNDIILIDFGISWIPGADNHIPLKLLPGSGISYIKSGSTRIYDLAFSFIRILEECGISQDFKQQECYKRIEQLVGVHTHEEQLPEDFHKEIIQSGK